MLVTLAKFQIKWTTKNNELSNCRNVAPRKKYKSTVVIKKMNLYTYIEKKILLLNLLGKINKVKIN